MTTVTETIQYIEQPTELAAVVSSEGKVDSAWSLGAQSGLDVDALRRDWYEINIAKGRQELQAAVEQGYWWVLPNTGFDVVGQLEKLLGEVSGESAIWSKQRLGEARDREIERAIERWLVQTREDMIAFKLEYLSDRLVYPINISKKTIGERDYILCPNYGGQLYEDTVSSAERGGVVKQSVKHIVNYLLYAPPGSVAFFTSPPGWSGIVDRECRTIHYEDTQTYIFRVKDEGEIEAAAIQTDMDLEQNRKLLKKYGVDFGEDYWWQTDDEQIKTIVGKVIYLNSAERQNTFAAIIRQIKEVMGTKVAGKGMGFDTILFDLGKLDKLMEIDTVTERMIYEFEEDAREKLRSVLEGKSSIKTVVESLGRTILKLSYVMRAEKEWRERINKNDLRAVGVENYSQNSLVSFSEYVPQWGEQIDYKDTLGWLQERRGCNGGGVSDNFTVMVQSAAQRLGVVDSEVKASSGSEKKIKCPECGWIPKNEADKKRICCPNCGWDPCTKGKI